MIEQFVAGPLLDQLWKACHPLRCVGAFWKIKNDYLDDPKWFVTSESASYDPTKNPIHLKLHCVASAAHDALSGYEASRAFVAPYGSKVEWKVTELLRKEKGADAVLRANLDLYSAMCWLLQRCAVVEYRASRYDHARGFLVPAYELSKWIASLAAQDPTSSLMRERYALHAMNCYWFACVAIYGNHFGEAERFLLEGLSTLSKAALREMNAPAEAVELLYEHRLEEARNPEPARQLVTYVCARLLLGLGLLHFFRGRLTDARSNLMTASVLLRRYSADVLRLLRCQLLMLSVKRMNNRDKEDLQNIERVVKHLAERFHELKHVRFYCRAMLTLAAVKVDLAKLYDDDDTDEGRAKRDGYLREARRITEDYHDRAADSVTDQLQLDILRIRILRKLNLTDEAIAWGKFILQRTSTKDQAFLHTESLLALVHAYYADFESRRDKKSLVEARRLLGQANSGGNYRLEAIRMLQMARVANQLGDHMQSNYQMNEWRHLEKFVEYDWISKYADIVKREIEAGNTIVLTIDSDKDVYKSLHRELRERLLNDFSQGRPDTELAEKLGVTRQTLHAWRTEIKRSRSGGEKPTRRAPDTSSVDSSLMSPDD